MKKLIPFLAVATLFASCKKETFSPASFPEAPKSIEVTYTITSKETNASSIEREVIYVSGWHEENDKVIPEYTTVTVTGNFKITVTINTIAVPVGKDSPGRTYRKIPVGMGWESTNNSPSVTVVDISSLDILGIHYAGSCPSYGRPLSDQELWFPDMY